MAGGWLFQATVVAQASFTKADVRKMFPENVRDLWINNLSGTLDMVHLTDMIIGTDGHTCKGIYRMRNSGAVFQFEGEDINHQLQLVELSDVSRRSGFIFGKYDGEKFAGSWMNADKNVSYPMSLSFVNSFEEYHLDKCKQQRWYRIYEGRSEGKDINLHIERDQLAFTIILQKDSVWSKDIVVGKGARVEVLETGIKNLALNGKTIVIDTSNLDRINIMHLDDKGYEISTSLEQKAHLDFECFEYADYYSKMVCNRPVCDDKKFNLWMDNKLKTWIHDNITRFKSVKQDNIGTNDRWIQSADAWVEIDLFLQDIVSGTIYLQTSLHPDTEKIAFIYDLSSNKELKLAEIFDNKFDSKDYFKYVISAKKKEVQWEKSCSHWVNQQDFRYATLNEDGIVFRTDFNSIYGEKKLIIPYEEVLSNIKIKNLIKEILTK